MNRIVAIVNRKGGVGKTTTAVNLAATMAASGKKTLLIDFDPQGNATTAYGINKGSGLLSIYDAISGHCSLRDAMRPIIGKDQLCLIPATADLSGSEVELVNTRNREFRLRECLKPHAHEFDWICIDCPPSLGLLTVNALAAAHGVLIPLQCEFYALEGLSQVLKTIEIIKKNINRTLEIDGVLLTMFEPDNLHNQEIAQEVRNHLADLTLEVTIPRDPFLNTAPGFGRPATWYHPWSPGSLAYQRLTIEIVHKDISA